MSTLAQTLVLINEFVLNSHGRNETEEWGDERGREREGREEKREREKRGKKREGWRGEDERERERDTSAGLMTQG